MSKHIWLCSVCARRRLQTRYRDVASAFGPLSSRRSTTAPYSTASDHVASSNRSDASASLDALRGSQQEKAEILAQGARQKIRRNIKLSEQYLDDPWHLGQHVERILAGDRFDEAYQLVQNASRAKQVEVSWNHLIEYLLEKDQVQKAFKVYNDMKKRAQLPNVQTFTIMFRGLAKSQHPKLAVAEAIKHYNVLMNDKRLKPNSIHLNAVLHVCARAGDLDSMFLIANTINDGERAATAYTYTIILNALRHAELGSGKHLPEDQQQANVLKTVNQAKGLWKDVIQKWNRGKLVVDEELVCAMGRILLMSPTIAGKREVLDLVEQTMRVPNLVKDSSNNAKLDEGRNVAVAPPADGVHAVPGRNTLALILTLLASTRELTTGIKYWNLLVRDRGIVPDKDNWLRLFGMLKVARSSAHAASMVEIVPDEHLESRHYRISMETCLRDGLNQNVVKNANRIMDSMLKRFFIPDLHTMRQYLEVSLNSHAKFRATASSGALDDAKREYGRQLASALTRLWEPYKKAHHHYFKTAVTGGTKEEGKIYNMQREVVALARHMVSTFNKVINENLLPDEDLRVMKPVAAKINREIQAFYHDRESKEPNLGTAGRDGGAAATMVGTGAMQSDQDNGAPSSKKGSRASRKDRNFATQSEFSVLPARPWVTYAREEKETKRSRGPQERQDYQKTQRRSR